MALAVQDNGFRTEVSAGTKGAISEHLATAWLMALGYDVFRNCSPNGRADLIAKNWERDETILVDVKSEGFNPDGARNLFDGKGNKSRQIQEYYLVEKNKSSDIRYLIVMDSGECRWYGDDSESKSPIWQCPVSGHQFPSPGSDMTRLEWYQFMYCVLDNHANKISADQVDFLKKIKTCFMARPRVNSTEKRWLEQIRWDVINRPMYLNDNKNQKSSV